MAGDGVSLPTNLAQLGNVAKTQARSHAQAHGPAPGQDLQKQDVPAVDRVRATDKTEQGHVDPDKERERKRKQQLAEAEAQADEDGADARDNDDRTAGLGGLIDIKA
jgi:hypothetical protein